MLVRDNRRGGLLPAAVGNAARPDSDSATIFQLFTGFVPMSGKPLVPVARCSRSTLAGHHNAIRVTKRNRHGEKGSDAQAVLRGTATHFFPTPPCGGWRNARQILTIACLSIGNGRPRTCQPIPLASLRSPGNNREGTPSFILPETRRGLAGVLPSLFYSKPPNHHLPLSLEPVR